MCQSSKPTEDRLFDRLKELSAVEQRPIPVGIAMTAVWARKHKSDFDKLIELSNQKFIEITWIDHSFHHVLAKQADGSYLFMTDPTVDLNREVLELEKFLIEQGKLPSPLFRFPGLTYNEKRLKSLKSLSLYALDSNMWIAKIDLKKGAEAQGLVTAGNVILVHGNGNEALGITRILDEINTYSGYVKAKGWKFTSPLHAISPLD